MTVCIAQLMLLVDSTVVNVALPSAQSALDFSTANREWVVTAYVLAFGSLLPLGGRLSDRWGRKLMFVVGALGFAAASAAGGAAQSFTVLIVARAAQGLFGALLLSLVGLGIGPPTVVGLDMTSAGVDPEDVGVAGSLANVVQQIGPAIGIAVLSTVAATATAQYATGHAGLDDLAARATVHGFTTSFWYGTAIFAAAAIVCTGLVRPGTRTGATSDPMELEALANLEAV